MTSAIDSDEWWLGDLALRIGEDRTTMLVLPIADGALMHIFTWGTAGRNRHEGLVRSAKALLLE